jgi:uncharacterized membrane protein
MLYFSLKYLHIMGAVVLIGTGAGIAFFMLAAHLDGKPAVIAGVARIVVIADFIFTASAVVVQPISGILLAVTTGYPLTEGWILWSSVLYVFIGALWVPVVFMQMRLRDLACEAVANDTRLSDEYHRVFWRWFAFGIPAFISIAVILWLMVAKPQI